MDRLVILSARTGELEKILSGVKTMLVKEADPAGAAGQPLSPGDRLYFLRDTDGGAVRVAATVVRVMCCTGSPAGDLSLVLKELQPRLQLTEDEYAAWSTRTKFQLVEFDCARKIVPIHATPDTIASRASWIAFEKKE